MKRVNLVIPMDAAMSIARRRIIPAYRALIAESLELNAAIAGRRAVRDYTDQRVDEDLIRELIGAAILAPGAVNRQPWTFTIVRDQGVARIS